MSIRIRLTLWYTFLLGTILVAYSVLLYMILDFTLHEQIDRQLRDRAQQVGAEIEARSIVSDGGQVVIPSLNVFASPATFVQIVKADGELVAATGNLAGQQIPYSETSHRTNQSGQTIYENLIIENTPFRIYNAPIIVGPPTQVVGAVQVGQSLKTIDTILDLMVIFLAGGTILALFLAGLVGMLIAKKALEPIEEINQTAARIMGAQDLKQRLPAPETYDEIGRLTVTVNKMLERLYNFFQAQVRLSADVSHELRTPLTAIRGNVDLLRRGAASDPDELNDALFVIDGELDRMSRIVADLLLLAQADAGLSLRMGTVELDTIILEVYRQARVMSNGVNIKLGHEDQAIVYGDTDRLKQLLINLVTNAIKHTPSGGDVTISLYRDPEMVRVIVADTGRGIAPAALPHIFERFYQANNATHKGSGLGLSIAQWIANAHNGQITVTSQLNKGSTFTLWLPMQTNPDRIKPLTVVSTP